MCYILCAEGFLGLNFNWTLTFHKNHKCFTIFGIKQTKPLLPYRFCGRDVLRSSESLLAIFARCEPLNSCHILEYRLGTFFKQNLKSKTT